MLANDLIENSFEIRHPRRVFSGQFVKNILLWALGLIGGKYAMIDKLIILNDKSLPQGEINLMWYMAEKGILKPVDEIAAQESPKINDKHENIKRQYISQNVFRTIVGGLSLYFV